MSYFLSDTFLTFTSIVTAWSLAWYFFGFYHGRKYVEDYAQSTRRKRQPFEADVTVRPGSYKDSPARN